MCSQWTAAAGFDPGLAAAAAAQHHHEAMQQQQQQHCNPAHLG